MGITIGDVVLPNRVFLAPMSGVTDEPFRVIAHECGAGMVVSEMVASEELTRQSPESLRRASGAGKVKPFVVQLAGREARWMGEAARIAENLGAQIIDINMGCPARKVTNGYSGAALMRDLDHATGLIRATVAATSSPVTLKMRLGWDKDSINAPELARRAEAEGVAMLTVHGRTRCQFYEGRADWDAIRLVRNAVNIPVVANGDAETSDDVGVMLARSGADAVMVGRGAYGRPWWPGCLADKLSPGSGRRVPTLEEQCRLLLRQYDDMLSHHGTEAGVRRARKHLGWTLDRLAMAGHLGDEERKSWRARLLCGDDSADRVRTSILSLYATLEEPMVA